MKPRVLSKSKSKTGGEQEEEGNERENLGDGLFACPEEGCLCRFLSHSAMIRHLDCGKHKRELEKETLYDKAAMEYGRQLEGQATSMVPVFTGTSQPRMQGASALPMGWALKSAGSKRSRFSAAQKSYLTDKFKIGELTKKKVDPASVARSMTTARNTNGSRLFTSDNLLTGTQIANFFSRLASKKTLLDDDLGEQFLDDEDVEAAAVEDELE